MNRRDLLDLGQSTAAALNLSPPAPPREIALARFGRRAMATTFEVLLPFGQPNAQLAAEAALDLIDSLEAQLTVYRATSEVSRLNRLARVAPVPVEARLFDLLALCARLSAETDGAFDITSGPLIKAWGFFRRQGRVPQPSELADALARVGMRYVEFDPRRRSVKYQKPGVEINLGSIGKGYALDRAAELLWDQRGVRSALLHGGTSSVLAIGAPPGDERGWSVGLKHPWEPNRRVALVRLRGQALATSGATYQHFDYNNRKLGHLLDPRTGQPAEGIALATALAPTAAEADALATAFYVLGIEPTRRYCAGHPGVSAILLPEGPDARLEVFNLPAQDIDLTPAEYATPSDQPLELA